jgi:hypothetical protein
MTSYSNIFQQGWRGWSDGKYGVPDDHKKSIITSKAKCYNDLYKEAIESKKQELAVKGGQPFYEPSTYYGSYLEGFRHNNVDSAASRYASAIFSQFSRYTAHKCTDIRLVPEERDEYQMKLWRISHPQPLTEAQRQLWILINEITAVEAWAWPMMIGLGEYYYSKEKIQLLPVVLQIQEKFMALGYTEEKFLEVQKELWTLLRWDTAKGM